MWRKSMVVCSKSTRKNKTHFSLNLHKCLPSTIFSSKSSAARAMSWVRVRNSSSETMMSPWWEIPGWRGWISMCRGSRMRWVPSWVWNSRINDYYTVIISIKLIYINYGIIRHKPWYCLKYHGYWGRPVSILSHKNGSNSTPKLSRHEVSWPPQRAI